MKNEEKEKYIFLVEKIYITAVSREIGNIISYRCVSIFSNVFVNVFNENYFTSSCFLKKRTKLYMDR